MRYLVDTNVLSELTRPSPNPGVVAWLREHEQDLVVSSLVLGELQYGILSLPAGAKRKRLKSWFERGVARFPVLDFDAGTASAWAELLVRLRRTGRPMPIKDSLVAAVALQHRLVVTTRNGADFRNAGVRLLDPFGA